MESTSSQSFQGDLTAKQRKQFYEVLSAVTWHIRVKRKGLMGECHYSRGTSFSIQVEDAHGNELVVILTSANCVADCVNSSGRQLNSIMARPVNSTIDYDVQLYGYHDGWDLALLQLVNPLNCAYGRLVDDDKASLYAGQPVWTISSFEGVVGGFRHGIASFSFPDKSDVRLPNWKESETLQSQYRSSQYVMKSCPNLPLIVISHDARSGSSGSPVFNSDGMIIGLYTPPLEQSYSSFGSAVHAILLRKFVQHVMTAESFAGRYFSLSWLFGKHKKRERVCLRDSP